MNKKKLTLGSLFDGSGGFPLGGILNGIEPKWASEVEPFPIMVTKKRIPYMKHLGDISTINGAVIEPVDIITWGSPCQGLSQAGKRKGLEDERSKLYVEAVRIVGEMLKSTNAQYPKFCVFENVPGLLSSNNGEDFITCMDMMQNLGFLPDVNILDAQLMGVPQRRKRVYITWVNVEYILQKRTSLSDSITLQLLTEILQINLAGLLKAYGIAPKKSGVLGLRYAEGGLKKRMKLFSLQEESHLKQLLKILEEMQVMYLSEQKNSVGVLGEDQMVNPMLIKEDTLSEDLFQGFLFMNIEQLLNTSLEEGLQIESEFTTLTWTKEIISQKICFYFQALVNIVSVTTALIKSLKTNQMCLNYFEWAKYTLIELRGFIDATEKYNGSTKELEWYDNIRVYKQKLLHLTEQTKRCFDDQCAGKILFESEGLSGDTQKGIGSWESFTSTFKACSGKASYGIDGYNGSIDEVISTLGVNCGMSTGRNGVIVLNDQGGNRMDITNDKTTTLRAEAHHPPCILESAGFCTEHSAKSRGIGFEEEKSPTLRAGVVPAAVYENHSQDCRYKGPLDVAQTVSATYGMGGNNQPFVVETPKTLKIRCGCEGGGKGALIQDNISATLSCNNDQTLFVPKAYGVCSKESNSMKSDNPNSGFYEAETSRTIDTGGISPSSNQGGIAVVCADKGCEPVIAVQGSVIGRKEENGPNGDGINEDVSFTLNTVDRHAVAYGIDRGAFNSGEKAKFGFSVEEEKQPTMVSRGPGAVAVPSYSMTTGCFMQVNEEKAPTLAARDYKDPTLVGFSQESFNNYSENDRSSCVVASGGNYGGGSETLVTDEVTYIVRRLTPTECALLQGFPTWWCSDLSIEEPTEEEIEWWSKVFETHRKIMGKSSKPKTRNQIIKWLKNPHSDSAEYKMWGNGLALPNVCFVFEGIMSLYTKS